MFSFFWSLPKAHDHWLINWELHFQSGSTLKLLHCYWILFMKFAIFLMSTQNSKTQLRACSTFWMRQLVFDSHVCSAHLTQAISFYFNQRTHLDETCDCSWVTPALLYNAATWFIFLRHFLPSTCISVWCKPCDTTFDCLLPNTIFSLQSLSSKIFYLHF